MSTRQNVIVTTRQNVIVTTSVICETEEQAVRAVEALSRVAIGLALEGVGMGINATPYDPDEEPD